MVYHQWYTTRATTAPGTPVDDVPIGAIETSLQELFQRYEAEPCSVTVVMGIRANPVELERLANARVCLQALNVQSLPRWRYRIVIVEQDEQPRLEKELAPFVDKYVFAYNPGPYNRGWAFNVGASLTCARDSALCLIDADLLVSPDFLQRCLERFENGERALLPYNEMLYLDAASTEQAIRSYLAAPKLPLETNGYRGRLFSTSQGGCIWVNSSVYHQIGGHDERFRGWGREDREFWKRLSHVVRIEQLRGRQLHLHHRRPPEEDRWALANQALFDRIESGREPRASRKIGDPKLYVGENTATKVAGHSREWENWHRWEPARIRKIVQDEQRRQAARSNRSALAEMLVRLGDSLLDVGCGPGALWRYFANHRPRFSWMGVDVTQEMLSVGHKLFPDVAVSITDAGNLPFRDGCFDVIVLRHVLEHVPQWLMERAFSEAMRVARKTVVVDFYVPPSAKGKSSTRVVGENFLETCWAVKDLTVPISNAGWTIDAQLNLRNGENDLIWNPLRPARNPKPRVKG